MAIGPDFARMFIKRIPPGQRRQALAHMWKGYRWIFLANCLVSSIISIIALFLLRRVEAKGPVEELIADLYFPIAFLASSMSAISAAFFMIMEFILRRSGSASNEG